MDQKKIAGRALLLLKGLGVGMTLLCISTLLLAYFIGKNQLGENAYPYGIALVELTASAIGSSFFVREKRKLISAILYALSFGMTLLVINVMFFDGVFYGVPATFLLIMCGSVLPLLIGRKRVKNYSPKQSFARYR